MATHILPYDCVDITGGFWQERQDLVRKTTIYSVYDRFRETGRLEALKLHWQEGQPNKPHIFWDSDVAKWMEAVAYLTRKHREPELEALVDGLVDDIARGQAEDGYFNSYYQQIAPDKRFSNRGCHELYCAGHLIEAAVAYHEATGKDRLLRVMEKYVALIRRVFMEENSAAFDTPGHEEIELALVRLYDHTGKREYLELAAHFLDRRASGEKLQDDYHRGTTIQDHKPVREQFTAVGHSVRALYLYCAMADVAERTGDAALRTACLRLFENITQRRMYITGGVGSTHAYEGFEEDYRLPNDTAYAETCAALALALFGRRMQVLDTDSRYADTVERVIYNGFLSGLSLSGDAFFYENAQEIDLEEREAAKSEGAAQVHYPITQRVAIFSCSCCPPNIARFIPSIGEFLCTYDGDTVWVHQYMASTARIGGTVLTQQTAYPFAGTVTLTLTGQARRVGLRIPHWCKAWSLACNGQTVPAEPVKGYVYVDVREGDSVVLDLQLAPRRIVTAPQNRYCRGQVALTYGPFVMCMEGVDNGGSLNGVRLTGEEPRVSFDDALGLPTLEVPALRERVTTLYGDTVERRPFTAKFIPYFAFANRGETDLRIWLPACY